MNRNRILIGLAVLVAAGFAALFGGVFRDSSTASASELVTEQALENFKLGFAQGSTTAEIVLRLQDELRQDARNVRAYVLLGLAYEQRARETGDPSFYPRAETALRRALELRPSEYLALSGLGSLALSRHRFADALSLGERARDLNPDFSRNHGVIGDALVELGRYPDAFRTFDTMNRLRPSLGSYARVSYGRELLGNTAGAIAAMKLAVEAASSPYGEPSAWAHVQLGKLYFSHGRLREAERELRLANAAFPSYAYGLDALAQVEAAKGDYTKAISLSKHAVNLYPLPQYVGFLGDLYEVTGRPVLAGRQYALIGAIERLLRANGVRTDLELALFDVDHGVRLPQALERARLAHRERPSIDADDVLGWALTRNGRCREALVYSQRALRLGTEDALKFFHRGMAERCLGHEAPARAWFRRALDLNPNFSLLWSPVARRYAS